MSENLEWLEKYRADLQKEFEKFQEAIGDDVTVEIEVNVTAHVVAVINGNQRFTFKVSERTGTGKGYRTPKRLARYIMKYAHWYLPAHLKPAVHIYTRHTYQQRRAGLINYWYNSEDNWEELNQPATALEYLASPIKAKQLDKLREKNDAEGKPLEVFSPQAQQFAAVATPALTFEYGEDLPDDDE